MATASCVPLHSPFLSLSPSPSPSSLRYRTSLSPNRSRARTITASSSMDHRDELRTKFMDFPYISTPHRDLMVHLVSAVENRVGSDLLPCSLPSDVQYFENQNGTAQASLHIRSGHESSLIDLVLGSWIHCELPTGGALNITSFSAYLNSKTDSPNFLIELIQSSPTSLVMILDLPPRKDLVLHQDYLKHFYEDTNLDSHRQSLESLPEAKPYISSSLFIRCACSPTAILIRVETEGTESEKMEELIKERVSPVAKEVFEIWLNRCAVADEREVEESEKSALEERDRVFRSKTIEVDLGSSFPRLFGQEVTNRVLDAMREAFGV